MTGQKRVRTITIGAALCAAILSAAPAAAILQGDCNDNMVTAINEVQRCANIFQGTQLLSTCPPCDQNGNSAVAINEVQGAANCFGNINSPGCRMSTPGPGGATNTPAATSTNTPLPTNTSVIVPTVTPVTPTATQVAPTATQVPPTATQVPPTATPVPPTNTPDNTPTATAGSELTIMGILPGGGTAGNCRGTCVGGPNAGGSCSLNTECPDSICAPVRACVGGTSAGLPCSTNANCGRCVAGVNMGMPCDAPADCPGSSCMSDGVCTATNARTCVGGPYDGIVCNAGTQCNGCDPARICTAAGVPMACCTGNAAGAACPLKGSCANIQGSLAIRLPLNGVCIPRHFPPGDIVCVTDVECKTCIGGESNGNACSTASHCPNGMCSGPGSCEQAEVGILVGPENASGERAITLPQESLFLTPAYVGSLGTACVTAGGSGMGVIDCNGGRAGINFTLKKDHNTVGTSMCDGGRDEGDPCTMKTDCRDNANCAGNSGSANGLPNDPTCDDVFVAPTGGENYTCREAMMQCQSGVNGGDVCDAAEDCPGSSCGACNIGTNGGPHPGACNSPTVAESANNFAPGDAAVAFPLAISLYDSYTPGLGNPPLPEFGPDGLPCTPDDDAPPPNAVPVALSTGTNSVIVYDNGNQAGLRIAPGLQCGPSPCLAQVSGKGIPCSAVDAKNFAGLILGGGFPALDSPISDISTTFLFELTEK